MNSKYLLLHGALGNAEQMQALASALKAHGEVESLTFSGHGSFPITSSFSMELFVSDIEQATRGGGKYILFGYSMGGYAALCFASKYPDRVEKVFTFATKFDWRPETAEREVRGLDPEKIEMKVPAFADALEKRFGDAYWKEVCRKTAAMMMDLGNNPPLNDKVLPSILCPVFLGSGSLDTMVPPGETQAMSIKLDAMAYIMTDTPHPFEKVDVQRLLNEFVLKS